MKISSFNDQGSADPVQVGSPTTPAQRCAGRTFSLLVAGAVWFTLVVAGFLALMREAYTPVRTEELAFTFPASAGFALDPARPTLLIFAHPQCPCTKASFRELDELRAQANDRLAVKIIFTVPPSEPIEWVKGDLYTAATRMKDIQILLDRGGILARSFHIVGSGHVLVYTPNGRLHFSGGITPSRGHDGDTPGGAAIVRMARGQFGSTIIQQPVYGCTLL